MCVAVEYILKLYMFNRVKKKRLQVSC